MYVHYSVDSVKLNDIFPLVTYLIIMNTHKGDREKDDKDDDENKHNDADKGTNLR